MYRKSVLFIWGANFFYLRAFSKYLTEFFIKGYIFWLGVITSKLGVFIKHLGIKINRCKLCMFGGILKKGTHLSLVGQLE